MSSIIVLDSSDEDESPPKKANLKSTPDAGNQSSVTHKNATIIKIHNSKQRSIPSSITVTQRPLTASAKTTSSSNNVSIQPLNSPMTMTANVNQPIANIVNQEQRQTDSPPMRGQTGNMIQNQRKRKTPTPPQPQAPPPPPPSTHQSMPPRLAAKPFSTMTNSSPAKAATTVAPLPPIMPMITGVHSMAAAGATPPLQLMATPPHPNMTGFLGLNEQLMINPHLIPQILPPNTTITAHPNTNPNQNNINNNFKIHLPLKPPVTTTTPSPAASPASSAPKTPSPQLAVSPQPMGRMDKHMRRVKPTTLLKSSDDAWLQQQRHKQSSQWPTVEMLPPSSTESPKSSSSASSSRQHTPMTSPKSRKSPDVIMVTPPSHNNLAHEAGTILDLTRSPEKSSSNDIVDLVSTPKAKPVNGASPKSSKSSSETNSSSAKTPETKPEKPPPKPPLEPEYEELIKTCREADPSADMEKLIKSKLLKYYYEVHGDFVKSKSFRKSIHKVVATIKSDPSLVYYNLKTIVDELKVRRKAKIVEEDSGFPLPLIKEEVLESVKTSNTTVPDTNATNTTTLAAAAAATVLAPEAEAPSTSATTTALNATASTSTGNKKLDEQIKKLNKALYVLTKRIEVLEQADVDWDDDDSSFLQVERFKKRACQIYEKICDLTGESKNAHRLVKKPIKFNETRIPQFNKTLQAFINRTKEFPDYYDVLRMLEHCNRNYNLGLVNFEIKNLAEDAFIKVGKLLQSRRKADLYETVTHYGGNSKDPAKSDPTLAAKLNENLKNYKKISDILEKFARKQDMPDDEDEEKAENSPIAENPKTDNEEQTATTDVNMVEEEEKTEDNIIKKEKEFMDIPKEELHKEDIKKDPIIQEGVVDDHDDDDEDEDDDDEDEDDEEDDDNLEEQVETLANGDVTDNESDNDISITKDDENPIKELISNKLKSNEISNNGNNNNNNTSTRPEEECLEILDKSQEISNNNNSSMECIEIHDNSQEEFIAFGGRHKQNNNKLNTTIIQIDADMDDDICMNNNNNNNNNHIEATTKTVHQSELELALIGESLTTTTTAIPNGKLRDTSPQQQQLSNPSSSPSCTATITSHTTTTKADLKIVHVSSLQLNTNSESSLCNDLTTSPMANKSLEEIIISDEES